LVNWKIKHKRQVVYVNIFAKFLNVMLVLL
jgi:hypothetical protein